MSEAEPCPYCGHYALFLDLPSVPEFLTDDAAEEFQRNSVPELSCRACGEVIEQMSRGDYEAD